MRSVWLLPVWLAAAASAPAFQATTTTAASGAIEGQIFSASTGAPLKKATVRLTAVMSGGARGMAMGQGQGQNQSQGGRGQAQGGRAVAGQPGQPGQPGTARQPQQGAAQGGTQTQIQALQGQLQTMAAGIQASIGTSNATRQTDETGRFSFTGLAAGQYRISVERQGYLRQSYGARKYNTSGTPITLKENQQMRDVVIRMNPQSVIVGKVLDEDGDPVVGLNVRAMKTVYRNGQKQWAPVNSGETNDIGVYRIPELDPGQYIVATAAQNPGRGGLVPMGRGGAVTGPLPDTPESIYVATYFPNGADTTSAVPVDLTAGSEMSGIDIHLRKTRVYRIRGKVANVPDIASSGGGGGRGARGGGMGGSVMVILMSAEGGARQTGSAARGPDYAFEIRGVPPGTYTLMASTNNLAGGRGPGGRGGSTGGVTGMMAIQHINVGSSHVDGIVLQLAAGAEIQGTVKVEGSNTPVALQNVNVTLRGTMPMGGTPRVRVAEDSTFALSGVSPLPYTVSVSGVPENCYVKSIRYGGQEVPETGTSMASGGVMEIILSATAGSVSATVADSNGNPTQNVTVALYPKDGPIAAAKSATTNESGGVTFKGLKPGDYQVIAWEDIPSGAYLDPLFLKPFEGRGESVKVGESGQATVQLKVIPVSETDR